MTLAKSPAPHSGQSVTMRPSRRRRMRPPSVPGAMTRLLLFPRPVDEQLFASPERKAQSEGFGLSVRVERAHAAPHGAAVHRGRGSAVALVGRGRAVALVAIAFVVNRTGEAGRRIPSPARRWQRWRA